MGTSFTATWPPALARSSHPAHGHGGGGLGDLVGTFVHAIAGSLGWQAGRSLAALLGPWLLVLAAAAIGWYLLRSRRRR